MTSEARASGVVARRRVLAALLGAPAAFLLSPRVRSAGARTAPADDPKGALVVPRGRELVLIQADGSGERTILSLEPGEFVADPAWSPDGGRIAFSRYAARPGEGAGGADLVVVGVRDDGGPPIVLVPRDRGNTLLAAPVWAPDGSGLAFENVGLTATGGAVTRVEWVGADGSGRRPLVEGGRNPAISPDGSTIAYLKTVSAGDGLWTRPVAGGAERLIVAEHELLALAFPRFSPDGAGLAFAGVGILERSPGMRLDLPLGAAGHRAGVTRHARHGLPWDLFMVDVSGARLRQLALLTEDDAAIAWSPDGRWIAVGGASGLRLVSVEDETVRVVAQTGSYGAIDWR